MPIQIGVNQDARRRKFQDAVNDERNRRLFENFVFQGHPFDFDPDSVANITGAGASAGIALTLGAEIGNLRWADPEADFVWLSKNNVYVPMDAQTCFLFSQAAMRHKSVHIFAARTLKDGDILDDVTDDALWPPVAAIELSSHLW